jgi:hypothetical protein
MIHYCVDFLHLIAAVSNCLRQRRLYYCNSKLATALSSRDPNTTCNGDFLDCMLNEQSLFRPQTAARTIIQSAHMHTRMAMTKIVSLAAVESVHEESSYTYIMRRQMTIYYHSTYDFLRAILINILLHAVHNIMSLVLIRISLPPRARARMVAHGHAKTRDLNIPN